uniref:Uncharacterized protein n=1 Tax=Pararge aegeria TaxID=116150 RepID=S4NZ86_9NEOP
MYSIGAWKTGNTNVGRMRKTSFLNIISCSRKNFVISGSLNIDLHIRNRRIFMTSKNENKFISTISHILQIINVMHLKVRCLHYLTLNSMLKIRITLGMCDRIPKQKRFNIAKWLESSGFDYGHTYGVLN